MLHINKALLSPCVRARQDSVLPQDWPAVLARRARETRHAALKNYYLSGMPSPDTPLSDVPLLAMDFETTGLNPQHDDIVSIGLLPMSLSRIRIQGSQHWILNPRADLRTESVVIHGITHSAIARAPDLNAVLLRLLAMMAGNVMVVHHKGIEQPFLDAAFKKRIGEGIVFPCIDTLTLEARVIAAQRQNGWRQKWWRPRPRLSLRLSDCRARYHLPYYPAHNALTDALGCAELLQAQIAHHFSASTLLGDLG